VSNDFCWWRDGIIYQIYPRSFADSNNDGIGDLPGIISRLDYLRELGIDAIWLSPFYPTPDADFGYDISNYTDVDPRFGTMDDFDELIRAAHEHGIRVVLDMVMNHTSDQHPWFIESRSCRENPKRDWYIWRDAAKNGEPPTNWKGCFGGSAWELDKASGQYYLHTFLKRQPDVNWHNPQVRTALMHVFQFWLEHGADGFRLDVVNAFFKDAKFRDNPSRFGMRSYDRQEHIYDMDRPEMIPLLQELRTLVDNFSDRYTVGEIFLATPEKTLLYAGNDRLHAAFSFDLIQSELAHPWNANWVARQINKRDRLFDAAGVWPTTVLSNHDKMRTASRYAKGENDEQAVIAMAVLLTVRGTPFMYYGEEIGMRDISLKRSEIMDPPGKRYWPVYKGRDGCRSPMQWSSENFGGFSDSKPWLPAHPNHTHRNVAKQLKNPASLLNFTRQLIALRRIHPALNRGEFHIFNRTDTGILAYERKQDDERILVYINFKGNSMEAGFVSDADPNQACILISSVGRKEFHVSGNQFALNPYEVLLLKIKPAGM